MYTLNVVSDTTVQSAGLIKCQSEYISACMKKLNMYKHCSSPERLKLTSCKVNLSTTKVVSPFNEFPAVSFPSFGSSNGSSKAIGLDIADFNVALRISSSSNYKYETHARQFY